MFSLKIGVLVLMAASSKVFAFSYLVPANPEHLPPNPLLRLYYLAGPPDVFVEGLNKVR